MYAFLQTAVDGPSKTLFEHLLYSIFMDEFVLLSLLETQHLETASSLLRRHVCFQSLYSIRQLLELFLLTLHNRPEHTRQTVVGDAQHLLLSFLGSMHKCVV